MSEDAIIYLDEIAKGFTDDEKRMAALVINRYGEESPVCDENNVSHFGRNHLIKCIKLAKAELWINDTGMPIINSMMKKLWVKRTSMYIDDLLAVIIDIEGQYKEGLIDKTETLAEISKLVLTETIKNSKDNKLMG